MSRLVPGVIMLLRIVVRDVTPLSPQRLIRSPQVGHRGDDCKRRRRTIAAIGLPGWGVDRSPCPQSVRKRKARLRNSGAGFDGLKSECSAS